MTKKLSALFVASALLLGPGACNQNRSALNNPPGTYEKKETITDEQGTTIEKQTSTEVSVDKEGHKKALVKSKTTKDPKGLFNKTTTSESKQKIEEKN